MTIPGDKAELRDLAYATDAIEAFTWEESKHPDRIGLELEAFPRRLHTRIRHRAQSGNVHAPLLEKSLSQLGQLTLGWRGEG